MIGFDRSHLIFDFWPYNGQIKIFKPIPTYLKVADDNKKFPNHTIKPSKNDLVILFNVSFATFNSIQLFIPTLILIIVKYEACQAFVADCQSGELPGGGDQRRKTRNKSKQKEG